MINEEPGSGQLGDEEGTKNNNEAEPSVDEKRNLIINYIPTTMNESALSNLFQPFGDIESVKIVKHRYTGDNLGYGFVKYVDNMSAFAAINALNGFEIEDKRIKVSMARPSSKSITRSNIYISGLPQEFGKSDLERMMSQFGQLIECRVLYQSDSTSRGVGFARFSTHESARKAIQALNDSQPQGWKAKIHCKIAEHPNRFKPASNGGGYMGGGGGYPYGHQMMGAMRGGFRNQYGANYYPQYNNPYGTDGSCYNGGYQQQQQQQIHRGNNNNNHSGGGGGGGDPHSGTCLFVYHLPSDCPESVLHQIFSNYGQVVNVKVMRDQRTGQGKGFGFVNLATELQATAAMQGLNGYQMGHKFLKVSFKK